MYLRRLMVLADELRALSSARFYSMAALETRYTVTPGRFPGITVHAESCEETAGVLSPLIRELGFWSGGEGIGLTILRSGIPAMLTILLPEDASRLILRASGKARRLGMGARGSRILEVAEALLGDREVAKSVALTILMETLADKHVAGVIKELEEIRETFSSAASEVRGL